LTKLKKAKERLSNSNTV